MDLDGEAGFDGGEKILEICYAEVRVNAALHEDLGSALLERFFDLPEYFVLGEQIGLGTVRFPVKCAESAFVHADIGIVDVAVNDERHQALGMESLAHAVSEFSQGQEIGILEQNKTRFCVDALTAYDLIYYFLQF